MQRKALTLYSSVKETAVEKPEASRGWVVKLKCEPKLTVLMEKLLPVTQSIQLA